MFADQVVELLPARTTMKRCGYKPRCAPKPRCHEYYCPPPPCHEYHCPPPPCSR